MTFSRRQVALVAALSLYAPSVNADESRARELFGRGLELYRQQHFAEALAAFRQAYAQAERPNIALNIAQCYRKLNRPKEAIRYYRLYIRQWDARNPGQPSPYQAEVAQHLTRLQHQLAQAKADRSEAARTGEAPSPQRGSESLGVPTLQKRTGALPALAGTSAVPPQSIEKPRPLYKRWWFWAAVGAVLASTAAVAIVAAQPGDATVPAGSLPPGTVWLGRQTE